MRGLVLVTLSSCVSYALPPLPDAGAAPAAVTITTLAPATSSAPGGPVSAIWAAYALDDGPWQPLAATATGTYGLPKAAARWAVAFACDDSELQTSTIAVYRRPASLTTLEVTLPEPCTLARPPSFELSGTLANVPQTTSWLEFGYALESRGASLPTNGTSTPYDLVNVVEGTWDFAFGVRDDSGKPMTRAAIVRGKAVSADTTFDVDLGTGFAPGQHALVVHGVTADENVTPTILYATGGPSGLAVGPQDVPVTTPDVTVAYSTIPDALQKPDDRYRLEVIAEVEKVDGATPPRVVEGSFHVASDVEVTMPDPIAAPTATSDGAHVTSSVPKRAGAASYVVDVAAEVTRRQVRRFTISIDAAIATDTETTPDLTSVDGFRPEWSLPSAPRTVTVSVVEPPVPLGDGTAIATASAQTVLPSP
ncbi:MAG TPA: hypothetical protein VIF62_33130 [Labilithrix sp.]